MVESEWTNSSNLFLLVVFRVNDLNAINGFDYNTSFAESWLGYNINYYDSRIKLSLFCLWYDLHAGIQLRCINYLCTFVNIGCSPVSYHILIIKQRIC